MISFVTLVNRMGTMALPFLVLYLTKERRWGTKEAGIALLVYGAGALTTAPFSGHMADHWGHLRVMKVSLLGSGVALLLIPLAHCRWQIYPLIFIWAAFTQAFFPSSMALLAETTDAGMRRTAFSLQRLAVNLGMSVGPAMGGVVAHQSYPWVFRIDGLTSLAAAVLLRWTPPGRGSHESDLHSGGSSGPWGNPWLVRLLAGFFLVLLVFSQIEGVLPLWVVKDLGLKESFFGLLFTVNTLAIVAFELPLNLRMAGWQPGHQLLLGSCLYAVGFGLTHWATTRLRLLAVVLIWTFGEMILMPAMSDAVATLAPPDRRGEYMGFYAATFAAAFTLGPWVGVFTYAQLGPSYVWSGGFILAFVGGCLLATFRPHMKAT